MLCSGPFCYGRREFDPLPLFGFEQLKKALHYGLLCGVLALAACSDPAPQSGSVDASARNAQRGAGMSASGSARSADGRYVVGDRLASESAVDDQGVRTLIWDELIPPDYNPAAMLDGIDLNALPDNDPRAVQLLADLKTASAAAPVVAALDGQRVRIPGFAVPLEGDAKQVTELLLVPYFGACIHVPPPPSNQIIHVLPKSPVAHDTLKRAVWVEGVMSTVRSETGSGDAGYRLSAYVVSSYQ